MSLKHTSQSVSTLGDSVAPVTERVIIVGTAGTVPGLNAALRAMGQRGPSVLGAVLADDGDTGLLAAEPGMTILGMIEDLPDLHRILGPTAALVSIPASMGGALSKIHAMLDRLGLASRHVAPMSDVLAGVGAAGAGGGAMDFASLIGRPPRKLEERPVRTLIKGSRVLITGAGGSIGSELALRCAALEPDAIFLMDRSENALFEIDRRIKAQFPGLQRRAILHDVVDADATLRRLVALRPQVVFHAAAHKHVPMMEDHPSAAVNNNLFGTKSIADASLATGVERFVMISTDKAVNPTSVMGATKRLAEVYVRSLGAGSARQGQATQFRVVRFGNVLGSACSVLPVWGNQIAEGGPVTVTHPAMTRYFMTIPEAAALVIQAAAVDPDGPDRPDVFVLDMGEPVRIRDLAERFVRAHGLSPHWEDPLNLADTRPVSTDAQVVPNRIRCVFTGIRPGEKLHEELSYVAEELRPTPVPGVMAWSGGPADRAAASRMVADLSGVRQSDDASLVLASIQRHVPEMIRTNTIQNTPAEAA